jgi:hypothetical protein
MSGLTVGLLLIVSGCASRKISPDPSKLDYYFQIADREKLGPTSDEDCRQLARKIDSGGLLNLRFTLVCADGQIKTRVAGPEGDMPLPVHFHKVGNDLLAFVDVHILNEELAKVDSKIFSLIKIDIRKDVLEGYTVNDLTVSSLRDADKLNCTVGKSGSDSQASIICEINSGKLPSLISTPNFWARDPK